MTKTKKTTKTAEKAGAAPKKRNAAQTIEALENAFLAHGQQIQILAEEIDRLRQMLVALNKRMNASIKAAEEGSLTGDSVNKIILSENVKELESKIQLLVDQGVLEKNNEMEISDMSFVVGRELDSEGNVVNPRVQFAVGSIDKSIKQTILSKKAGDKIVYSETEPSLEIMEVYEIHQPSVKQNLESQAPAAQ